MSKRQNFKDDSCTSVAAVVMAAGMSRRMGEPKMVLPWGKTTVIGQVVHILQQAGITEIVVVTGSDREMVEVALKDSGVRTEFNEKYQEDHMLLSLKTGIYHLSRETNAALVVLGDQPQILTDVVRSLIDRYCLNKSRLTVPSFNNRRGHPWLVDRSLWSELLMLSPQLTLRQWLQNHSSEIDYLEVHTDSILKDLDTPVDYSREMPGE